MTSYLKPYFNWQHDDHVIDLIFIDSDGSEIKARLDYRKKLISGFKEWFQKMDLEVNDTILIGLIDQSKKRYFILPEKEKINKEMEKDMGNTVYQILHKEGNSLSYDQIYAEITRQGLSRKGIFDEYIEDSIKEDNRFVVLENGNWALSEWQNEEERSYHNLLYSENWENFYHSLQKCFKFLGYEIELSEQAQSKIFVARAWLASKSYSIIISGLPINYNIRMVNLLDWNTMKMAKEKAQADSIILFLKDFNFPELIRRASEEGVRLYEISFLEYLIREHNLIPFSLFELRIAFNPINHPQNNLNKLKRVRRRQWKNWRLIKLIIQVLQSEKYKDTFLDIDQLAREIKLSNNPFKLDRIDHQQLKKIVSILSQEPFKILDISPSGNIVMVYPDYLALEKICNIGHFIIN